MTIELNAVTDHLLRVHRMIRQLVEELATARGLTQSQVLALRFISQHPDCSMQVLTGHLHVTRAAVTSIVDRLEAEGLVRRQAGSDRRYFHLRLTPEGEAAIAALRQELLGRIRRWVGALPDDKAEALADGLAALSAMVPEEARRG